MTEFGCKGTTLNPLPPLIDVQTRLLLVGSLPGTASIRAAQYYAHPRNQFWRLLSDVLDTPLMELEYHVRLAQLQQHGVGLWDAVQSAIRPGSLDSNMRSWTANDPTSIADRAPDLVALAFNGIAASRTAADWGSIFEVPHLILPSSSPANTLPYAVKRGRWLLLRAFL